jgi:hypothetical protein
MTIPCQEKSAEFTPRSGPKRRHLTQILPKKFTKKGWQNPDTFRDSFVPCGRNFIALY